MSDPAKNSIELAIAQLMCPELDKFTELLARPATPAGDAAILLILGDAGKHKEELIKLKNNHSEVLKRQEQNLYLAESSAEACAYISRIARTKQILETIERLLATM